MKTFAALAIALTVSAAASAEPFNNRGTNYIDTAPVGTSSGPALAGTGSQGFNDRGVNYIVDAPAGSAAPRESVAVKSSGFNRRDSIAPGTVRSERYTALGWNR